MTAAPFTVADRRALILELLRDDIDAGVVRLWRDLYPLIRLCDELETDRRGTCVLVRRLQARSGRASWDGVMRAIERVEANRRGG